MKKTLLLVFIHGFKGGDDTFDRFPPHLRAILSHALPKLTIIPLVYPAFETRGDLRAAVQQFKEWLQNKVIDLEVANGTPSPTVSPSVHTVLIGHSMGGIVAAETVLSILEDTPVPPSPQASRELGKAGGGEGASDGHDDDGKSSFMFPYIRGILAFDTPYLGLHPGVVAHGAEAQWNTANAAYSAYSNVASVLGWGGASAAGKAAQKDAAAAAAAAGGKMLPAASSASSSSATSAAAAAAVGQAAANPNADTAAAPAWQRWGRYAMFAGAAGAVAVGGAAAYMKREQLGSGWQWIGSHLEFVGCLARGAELQARLERVMQLTAPSSSLLPHRFGFANLYTSLGDAASAALEQGKQPPAAAAAEARSPGYAASVLGSRRTFCTVPKSELASAWVEARNDKAASETWAHMTMFTPRENPGYYAMSERAKDLVAEWCRGEWYEEAEPPDNVGSAGLEEDVSDVEMVEKEELRS